MSKHQSPVADDGGRTPPLRPAPTHQPILDVLRNRWSAREIDSQRPVDRGVIGVLL